MGNRALVIFTDGNRVSPVVYLHWSGGQVPEWLADLKQMMAGREGDVAYSCARFIGLCHTRILGNLSLGVWNAPPHIERAVLTFGESRQAREQMIEYSHGDAGVIIVHVADYNWQACGGYLHSQTSTTSS